MFGYFKRKDFFVHCPVCTREYKIKFNPDEVKSYNYRYREGAGVVFTLECDYCGTESKIVQFRTGEVDTVDHKWGKTKKEYEEKMETLRKELASGGEKIKLEAEMRGMENRFAEDEKKYEEFRTLWRDKWKREIAEEN